jgi:hypothetical protein
MRGDEWRGMKLPRESKITSSKVYNDTNLEIELELMEQNAL